MTIRVYVLACIVFTSLLNGAQARKGDGAPWGSYFSRGFGGIYSPDDFAPDPRPLGRLEHRNRGRSHSMYGSQADGYDDTQRTLGDGHTLGPARGDVVQGHIPAVPDTQSRNVPYDSKQSWAQDTQHDTQHDWSQDFQDDTQQDFQDDSQQDFQDDSQHDADPQDLVTGYPPAKGHHPPPDVIKHTIPRFHHTTYQPPVQHTTYQPEPPTQHTTWYATEPSVDHTPYQTPTPEYPTPYHTETTEQHYTTEPSRHTTTQYPTEKTTYDSYDTTKHPGSSDYEMTTSHPSPSEEGVCRPNPAADGYPPGTKLICTVEVIICDPIWPTKSQKGEAKNTGKSTTLICKPFNGCDEPGYTTKTPEYTTNDHGYTTEHTGYTTEGSGHTTEGSGHTTEGSGHTTDGGYTTEKPAHTTDGGYTTEGSDHTTDGGYTTEKPAHTTDGGYTTEKPAHTTEKPEYPTTHSVTHKPVTITEHYSPNPTLPPHSTPRDEETTPCVNKPGVKGHSRGCGVKGGVKGGYRQAGWSNWSSWNPWSEWESKREGTRKQHTSWLPKTQPQRHEIPRRPVWNGAWPSSWSAQGSAPVYVEF